MNTAIKNDLIYKEFSDKMAAGKDYQDALIKIWDTRITETAAAMAACRLVAHFFEQGMLRQNELHTETHRLIEKENVLKVSSIAQNPNFLRKQIDFDFN